MKYFMLALIVFSITSCNNDDSIVHQNTENIKEVIHSFEKLPFKNNFEELDYLIVKLDDIFKNEDAEGLLEILDPEYLNEQLYDFHQGNTSRFINELFCGQNINAKNYVCLTFDEIDNYQIINIEQKNENFKMYLEFTSSESEIKTSFFIRKRNIENQVFYYLVGAVG